jgi:hypothetical protein
MNNEDLTNEDMNCYLLYNLYDTTHGVLHRTHNEYNEYYDIDDVKEALIELKKLDFSILSNKDKYKLYTKLKKLYKCYYKDVYILDCEDDYENIILDIINNIKYFFSLLQTVKLEDIIIELMKPSRVLNRLTTYDEYEFIN